MNCFAQSDVEFAEQIKLLSGEQLEQLGIIFQRRYEILRAEYQNRPKNVVPMIPVASQSVPMALPTGVRQVPRMSTVSGPLMSEEGNIASQPMMNGRPHSPTRIRRSSSPRRRTSQ